MASGTERVKGTLRQRLFGGPGRRAAEALYARAVAAARAPEWYEACGVPDTIDGRFDLILLHLFALMERLARLSNGPKRQRALTETFFDDMDRSLREIGASDTGLPRRMRAMAEAYLGRMQAYSTAFKAGPEAWRAALARNLLNDAPADAAQLEAIAARFAQWDTMLRAMPDDVLLSGAV